MFVLWWVTLTMLGGMVQANPTLDWWQTTVFYQIYPRSFQDSDGDGVGDLNGITSRLDHLKDIGVGAVWLSPIFRSPMADFGYDIADFRDIDPVFGTLEDFDRLVDKAKQLGLKVILDFVPNHSSDENEWFLKSAAGDAQYRDYYIWRDPAGYQEDGTPIPPNNWLSLFLGPGWKFNEQRNQFYLHQFHYKQPDLNYRDPKLVQEMKDVLTFWLDRGVCGFRVDAIPCLFEDVQGRNEPPSNIPGLSPDDADSLLHIYTQNQEETFDMVQQWRELLDEYSKKDNVTRVMMTEAYANMTQTMRYYGTEERRGAHFTFNFNFIAGLGADPDARDVSTQIDAWLDNMPGWAWANWVIGNHDNHRVASRFGSDLGDGMVMVSMALPGTAVTYNGEEIGMLDTRISYEDTVDPAGCNAGPEGYEQRSRDPERTPFQWDDSVNSGFSSSNKTWLPVNSNYRELNLEAQKRASVSRYHFYKKLVRARASPVLPSGSLKKQVVDGVLVLLRELEGLTSFLVLVNFDKEPKVINIAEVFSELPMTMSVYVASIDSQMSEGMNVMTSDIHLEPKASVMLQPVASAIKQ